MNTYTVKITGTDYTPYSGLSSFNVLDGGFLYDPLAAPLSFFYSLTTNGGTLTGSNSVFNLTSIGGSLETNYNDLKNYNFKTKGNIVFCETKVTFDFSNFDQTRSLIKSIIFDSDNSEKKQIYSIKINQSSLIYPELNKSNSLYYPKEKYYTVYEPKFIINYNDGTSQTIVSPLTVAQCGILDSYKNKSMLDSLPYFKQLNNVAIFVNDKKNNDLLISLLDVKSPFVADTSDLDNVELPFSVAPIPLGNVNPFTSITQINLTPSTPQIPPNPNPIDIPLPVYRYQQSSSISLDPDPSDLIEGQEFNFSQSLTLSIGGAPYSAGEGISIVDSSGTSIQVSQSNLPTTPQTNLPTTPQQFSTSYNGTTFRGYYQLQENTTSFTDVILAFGGTIQDPNLVMDNALNQLNRLRDDVGIKNKTIVAIAYPQNVLMGGDNNNIPESEAALLWLKSNPTNILGVNVDKIFLFGHSQGGYIVSRLNTMYETDGVISSAPGPINLQIRCQTDETKPYSERNRDCNALFDVYGSATGVNQQQYVSRSLISFTRSHKSRTLYIQGLGDTPFQVARYNEYIDSLNTCTNCAPYTQVLIPAYGTLNPTTGMRTPNNHFAYFATEQGRQAILNFLANS